MRKKLNDPRAMRLNMNLNRTANLRVLEQTSKLNNTFGPEDLPSYQTDAQVDSSKENHALASSSIGAPSGLANLLKKSSTNRSENSQYLDFDFFKGEKVFSNKFLETQK